MMKWWVYEIKLRHFTLNLNEKLCKRIFAKRIRPEYFQNLQMVLSMFCNDDKICGKKSYFGINIPKVLLRHPIFFYPKRPLQFWKVIVILSFIPTVSCSAERSLSILQSPKTDQNHHGIGLSQPSGTVMCWTCLFQQSKNWKGDCWVFIRKCLFLVLVSDLFWIF